MCGGSYRCAGFPGKEGEVGTQGNRNAPTENIYEMREDKSRRVNWGYQHGDGGWGNGTRKVNKAAGGAEKKTNNPSAVAMSEIYCYNLGENQPIYATHVIIFIQALSQINSFP